MKKYIAIVMAAGSFFAVVGVGRAAPLLQATDTPTATDTPAATYTVTPVPLDFMTTATPWDEQSIECPEGTPIGYGTVTPEPLWEMFCSQCIGAQYATETPDPLTPTATVTNTPEPTATGTTIPDHYYQGAGWDSVWYANHTYGWYQMSTNFPLSLSDPIYGYTIQGELTYRSGNNNLYFKPMNAGANTLHGDTSVGIYPGAPFKLCMAYAIDDVAMNNIFDSANVTGCTVKTRLGSGWNIGGLGQTKYIKFMYEWGHDGYIYLDYLTPIYWGKGIIETTPTPTPSATPTPFTSYCNQVVEGGEVNDFGWGGLQYGTAACLDIGPYYIELFGVPLGIPEIGHICFLPVTFGVMYLFGVAIQIDAFLLILVGIAILRMVTR